MDKEGTEKAKKYLRKRLDEEIAGQEELSDERNGKDSGFPTEEFINQRTGGHTLKERISIYTKRLEYEMETWIAAGLALGIAQDELRTLWLAYRTRPYSNPIFSEAKKLPMSGTRFRTGGISYGAGKYVSAENSLVRLERSTVAQTMRQCDWEAWNARTAAGYIVGRGSSYPCSLCDSMAGFHYPDDIAQMPPYHANCCCWSYPVYRNGL